jgi:hypothetical protein
VSAKRTWQASRNEVEKLREELAAAEQNKHAALYDNGNAVEKAQLDAEAERLKLEIARVRAAHEHQQQAGAEPLVAAKDAMKAAVEAQKVEAKAQTQLAKVDEKNAAANADQPNA